MPRSETIGLVCILGMTLALMCTAAWAGPSLVFPEDRRHIALDPGHGGDDSGARGPTGLLEKTFCLEIARALALQLENRYRVTLTRSDDYHVQLDQRAAIANEGKANLFVSLHGGASFEHAARGVGIYFYAPKDKASQRPTDPLAAQKGPLPWRQVQVPHLAGSQALARALKPHMEKLAENSEVRVKGAPLALLEGVDMPAVLIELGHITNPATEQRMASSQAAASLVQAIDAGIAAFFQSRPAKTLR